MIDTPIFPDQLSQLQTAVVDAPDMVLDDAQQAVVDALLAGNARFLAGCPEQHDYSAERAALTEGQSPVAAILSCSDSRVPPELLLDQAPGDLFVVRVAGNFVTGEGLASLEYGVELLKTRLIVVLGHTGCGAVGATLGVLREQNILPGHIQHLIRDMKPGIAREMLSEAPHLEERAVVANVRYNVRRLVHSEPILSARVNAGELAVIGAVYDLNTGQVVIV
ncbi:carbonic anhydrase [Brevundimonas sp.]|uniref:carbonic anhydrase n=1 Tax=Brevundimonas sp. TaxID=1871086 RepID=UPI002FCB8BEC